MPHSEFEQWSQLSPAGASCRNEMVSVSQCKSREDEKCGPREEVSQMHELAVVLVLDVDDSPAIFTTTNCLPIDDHITFRTDNCEWNDFLQSIEIIRIEMQYQARRANPDGLIQLNFLIITFVRVEGVQADVVINQFFTDLQTW